MTINKNRNNHSISVLLQIRISSLTRSSVINSESAYNHVVVVDRQMNGHRQGFIFVILWLFNRNGECNWHKKRIGSAISISAGTLIELLLFLLHLWLSCWLCGAIGPDFPVEVSCCHSGKDVAIAMNCQPPIFKCRKFQLN